MEELDKIIKKEKEKFIEKDISLISQNCIGGVVYHDMGMRFLSPTINLYFDSNDFIKFVSNLQYYLNKELKIVEESPVIIGMLEDVKIYFLHYEDSKTAKEKWDERSKRILNDKIFIISTDRDGFNEDDFIAFKELSYKKALITCNKKWSRYPFSVYLPQYKDEECVPNTIPTREFYKNGKLIDLINKV